MIEKTLSNVNIKEAVKSYKLAAFFILSPKLSIFMFIIDLVKDYGC
jgi:hypothetical protein